MNEEEKWLKSKIENAVNENASFRLAEVKEKAVTADAVKALPAKKRSVLKTALTAVSCVVVALTVAALAASPFIFKNPPATPGDGKELTGEASRAPVESSDITEEPPPIETSEEEPYTPFCIDDPIVECMIANGIADGAFTIENVYMTDHPETDYLQFPTNFDSVPETVDWGSSLAIRVRRSDPNWDVLHYTYYFAGFGSYVRGIDFYPDGKPDIDTICEIIKTSPFVFEVVNVCDDAGITSLEDVLKYAGFAKTDIDRAEYHYYSESGEMKLCALELYPTDMSEGYYTLIATPDSESVRQLFGEYEIIKEDGSALLDSFIVPVSALNAEQLDFVGANIISNMSGTIRRDSGDNFAHHIAKLFGYGFHTLESLEEYSDDGGYGMHARFKDIITEFCTRRVVFDDVYYRISEEDYNSLTASSSLGDLYIAAFRAMKNGAAPYPARHVDPSYDTTTSRLISEYIYDMVPALRGTVIKAVYNDTDPDSLRIKVRREYGTVLDAVFKSTSHPEWGNIYFDNTEEIKEGGIDFVRSFISSAENVTASLEKFDFSDCSDGEEALNKLFNTVYEDTVGFEVCKVTYVENEKINEYSLCFYGISKNGDIEYFIPVCADDADVIENIFDSEIVNISVEDVAFAAKSFVKQTTETYDLHGGHYYDPETIVDVMSEKTGLDVVNVQYVMDEEKGFLQIIVNESEGGYHAFICCDVSRELIIALASYDESAIASALKEAELSEGPPPILIE